LIARPNGEPPFPRLCCESFELLYANGGLGRWTEILIRVLEAAVDGVCTWVRNLHPSSDSLLFESGPQEVGTIPNPIEPPSWDVLKDGAAVWSYVEVLGSIRTQTSYRWASESHTG